MDERELAARFNRATADVVVNRWQAEARLYNLERARYLEQGGKPIPSYLARLHCIIEEIRLVKREDRCSTLAVNARYAGWIATCYSSRIPYRVACSFSAPRAGVLG